MRRALALCLAVAGPVAAAPALDPADLSRLDRFDEAAGEGLLAALSGGAQGDLALLTEALSGRAGPPAPSGDWSCRTIRLGGVAPLAVFAPFACRIEITGPTEWRFEKLTGSERSRGVIALTEGRAIYRGAGFTGDAPAGDYADLPEGLGLSAPGETHRQVAVFEQTGPDAARLMFPFPVPGATFDILYLTR
ncbi:DUF4893 domain-containing protein [Palleronia sediminis]|uniref:DUF4893 domain-containing protein n=1 Tax=Palleronia sediminis TaxID=2547833 RepID=A0A4R6AFK6_9RHOB|nr:DUF4893 domain-containing protein [Palleronia sediminis]TDL81794.1 DUF4893 domain-containing protein [Palleronia sediminis]